MVSSILNFKFEIASCWVVVQLAAHRTLIPAIAGSNPADPMQGTEDIGIKQGELRRINAAGCLSASIQIPRGVSEEVSRLSV